MVKKKMKNIKTENLVHILILIKITIQIMNRMNKEAEKAVFQINILNNNSIKNKKNMMI